MFEKAKIKIKNKNITVEIADTPEKQQQGLMFRKKLEPNHGMLFIFDSDQTLSFWMKNTIIDLSIAYINSKFQIIDILEMQATSPMDINPPSYPSSAPAQFALEMEKGWFKKNQIKIGDKLILNTSLLRNK